MSCLIAGQLQRQLGQAMQNGFGKYILHKPNLAYGLPFILKQSSNGYILSVERIVTKFSPKVILDTNDDTNKNILLILKVIFSGLLSVCVSFHMFLKFYPSMLKRCVFIWRLDWRVRYDLSTPEFHGLKGATNFHLESTDSVRLGVWQIEPTDKSSEDIQQGSNIIILYFHGRSGTRGDPHRVALYKVLVNCGLSVVAFDYRGFGDSSGSPSEEGVTEDGITVYKWITRKHPKCKVMLWGHSLGAAIATNVTQQLCKDQEGPAGLILESSFQSFKDYVWNHPLALLFRVLPWMPSTLFEALDKQNLYFSTEKYLVEVTVPTLILHAEDDGIVPYKLGVRLYVSATKLKTKGGVGFKGFKGGLGYGHSNIWKSSDLPEAILSFVEKVTNLNVPPY